MTYVILRNSGGSELDRIEIPDQNLVPHGDLLPALFDAMRENHWCLEPGDSITIVT